MLIAGVGNLWRRDDGIGPATITHLKNDDRFSRAELVDGGMDALVFLDIIAKHKRAIIIDAVNMNMVPGTIKCFTPSEARLRIQSDALSTHGIGLAEMIELMQKLDISTEIKIIGIQPYDISFGHGLTDDMAAKVPAIIDSIAEEEDR